MNIKPIQELNEKEKNLVKYLVGIQTGKPSLVVNVNVLCRFLEINIKDERNKHEAITENLVNIISIPTMAKGKQIPFIEGWELDTQKAVLSLSPEYLENMEEANDYLLNCVCNPHKMSFILN